MPSLDFMKTYSSNSTIKTYASGIKGFLESVYGVRVTNGELEKLADRYFQEKRNREKDIDNFLISMKGRPPKTVNVYLAAVKTLLIENGIELKQLYWRRIKGRIKGSRAWTKDRAPSNLELRKIISNMPIQGRALYLALSSSGLRIGEGLALLSSDLKLDKDPVELDVRPEITKTGNGRVTFISTEAKDAVQEWLKLRDSYLKTAVSKSRIHKKNPDNPFLFPFQDNTAIAIWIHALEKAGLTEKDKSTDRLVLHPHSLRKFFRSRLGAVIPPDIVEALMGHEEGLTEVYRKYSAEELAEFYKKGEHSLLVFTNGAEVTKLKVEVDEKTKQLQTIINGLASENMELKGRVKDLEGFKARTEEKHKALDVEIEELKRGNEEFKQTILRAIEGPEKKQNAK